MTTAEKVSNLLNAIPDAMLLDIFNKLNAQDPYSRTPEEMKTFGWTFDEMEKRGFITWDDDAMPYLNGKPL